MTLNDMTGAFAVMHNTGLAQRNDMLECTARPEDDAHEAARVHYASRRRCSCMAARGAVAAAGHAGGRGSQQRNA